MKAFRIFLTLFIPIAIVVGGLEVSLRLLPELVPLPLLQHFHEAVRLDNARKRDLPNRTDVEAVERDDGGPLLTKYRPQNSVTLDFGDEGSTATIVTDDLGFCNPPSSSYSRESYDIVVIGDSLAWCTAVEPGEAFPFYLGEFMGMSSYNLGRPGVGLYEYLVFLRKYGLEKSPRIVVMNFTEGNDLRDALRYWRHKNRADDSPSESTAEPRAGFLGSTIGSISYTYNLVAAVWLEVFNPRARDATEDGSIADSRLASIPKKSINFRYTLDFGDTKVPFNIRNADRDEVKHSVVVAEGLVPSDIFDDAFEEFMRLSREHDFIPVVTYSPSSHIAYKNYAVYEETWVGAIAQQYSQFLRDLVAEKALDYGFHYLDLTPLIWAEIENQGSEKAEKLLYYPASVHYSVEGNRFIASEMAKLLKGLQEPD